MSDDDELLAEMLAKATPTAVWAMVRVRGVGTADETIRRQHGSTPATPDNLAKLARRLPGGANRGGRPDQREDRLASYGTAILALHDKGYRPAGKITAGLVAQHIHRSSPAQLRKDVADPDIGGWRAFRAEVLRAR
jgi:hypothetical protein